ncbi:MAG: hypothetical protein WC796_04245 [Candidatus Pacearchaeota archaeon]|jgi:hypothetical protein
MDYETFERIVMKPMEVLEGAYHTLARLKVRGLYDTLNQCLGEEKFQGLSEDEIRNFSLIFHEGVSCGRGIQELWADECHHTVMGIGTGACLASMRR